MNEVELDFSMQQLACTPTVKLRVICHVRHGNGVLPGRLSQSPLAKRFSCLVVATNLSVLGSVYGY